jgi:UDP-N-acetylglucosamine 4,6-dehydratase
MRSILLTGGSGSFGLAFIAHALASGLASRVVSFSRNATQRYALRQAIPDPRLVVLAGDVTDPVDFERVPEVDTIIHAAAEKHIDTSEDAPYWVDKINIGGAERVIEFAQSRQIRDVVALSTDKACDPCNAYGRSKARAEALFTQAGFTCVRYGNVVNSSGSVLPLFIEQRRSGRLTITDRRMTRYFMPLSDEAQYGVYQEPGCQRVMSAVGLVLYALAHRQGGEIFIPTIPSGSIQSLAEAVGPGCAIDEIGIRPGEKLHEDLISVNEADRCWHTADGVYVLMPNAHDFPSFPAARVASGFSYDSSQQPQPVRLEFPENRLCESASSV